MPNFNGSPGDDTFTGGDDDDTAVGNGGADTLSGGGGRDLLVGNAGADRLDGGDGDDTLYSGDESPPFNLPYFGNPFTPPLLDTGREVDTLIGGAGNDRLFGGYGDHIDGGGDSTSVDYLYISFLGAPTGVTADFRLASQTIGGGVITGIENISWIQGSNYDDDIIADTGPYAAYSDFAAVYGMGGNDRLVAGYYTGTLFGGDGNDVIDGRGSQYLQSVNGDDGNDILYTNSNTFATANGGAGDDTIYSHGTTYGGDGNDLILLQFSFYTGLVFGEGGNDDIRASDAGHMLIGGAGADSLTGGSRQDFLFSGDRDATTGVAIDDMGLERDILTGFGGDDTLAIGYGDNADGGSGTDTLRLSLGGMTSGVTFNTAGIGSGQSMVIVGGGVINSIETFAYLRGTDFADVLTLATQSSLLTVDAGLGDDVIVSSGSSVVVRGNDGNDRFVTGPAGDTFDGGAGNDTVDYSNAAGGVISSLVAGAAGNTGGDSFNNVENLIGSRFDDRLTGDSGANTISGGGGGDTLNGGDGDDSLSGQTGRDSLLGGAGADALSGGRGNDTLLGGDGNDVLSGDRGRDSIDGGAGTDVLIVTGGAMGHTAGGTTAAFRLSGPSAANRDQVTGVERISVDGGATSMSLSEFQSLTFQPLRYLAGFADLRAAFGTDAAAARSHFESNGKAEGRDYGQFDAYGYLASYRDLALAFGTDTERAASHFITNGLAEGRRTDIFDSYRYIASNRDLITAFGDDADRAILHYLTNGVREGRSIDGFDPLSYSASNADVAIAFGTDSEAASLHYIASGAAEGRPTTGFDSVGYLLGNRDLAGLKTSDALLHYLDFGAREGRQADGGFGSDQLQHAFSEAMVIDQFSTVADRDWFSVNMISGQTVTLNGSDAVGSLELYDALGRTVASDADGRDFVVSAPTGNYYLVATAAGNVTGAYTISRTTSGNSEVIMGSTAPDEVSASLAAATFAMKTPPSDYDSGPIVGEDYIPIVSPPWIDPDVF